MKSSITISLISLFTLLTISERSAMAQFADIQLTETPPVIDSSEIWTIKNIGTRPTIMHDNRPVAPLFFYNRGYDVKTVTDGITHLVTKEGVSLHIIDCPINWGNKTYGNLAERIQAIRKINPDSFFLLRLYLWAPDKWGTLHPDEIVHTINGKVYKGPFACTSYSSQKWIDQTLARIDNTFLFMKEHNIYDYIIGTIICAGGTGEWNLWSYRPTKKEDKEITNVVDYSPAMKKYFQHWLENKYPDIKTLNARYGTQLSSFTECPLPNENIMRGKDDKEWFRTPATPSIIKAQDYSQAYADAVADSMLIFASRIRKITKGKRIIGTWFGQHLQATYGGSWGAHKNGYLAENRILNSSDIDLVITPPLYITTYGSGSGSMQNFPDVWQQHGKFCLYEMDTPSHLLIKRFKPEEWFHKDMRSTYWGVNGKPYKLRRLPYTLDETLALYRRAFGICMIEGFGMQFWDMEGRMRKLPRGVFYDHPAISSEFNHMQKFFKESLNNSRKSVAEIAVIWDNEAIKYTRPMNYDYQIDLLIRKNDVETSQIEALNHCGVPYDTAYLADFNNLKKYKLYIFMNAWHLIDRQIKAIHTKLASEGSSAVWIYAPGYANNEKLDVNQIKNITGIPVQKLSAGKTYMKEAQDAAKIDIKSFSTQSSSIANPRFAVNPDKNSEITIWGEEPKTKLPLAGMRKMPDGWTSYYTAAAPLTMQTWADIARRSGCHIYTAPGVFLRINQSYIMVHGIGGRKINLTLPYACTATDLFSGKIISNKSNKITIETRNNEFFTSILHLEK